MVKENNYIKRKSICILLILALIITELFSYPNTSYAEKVVLSEETYYHLDMGVQVAYQGNEWEPKGFDYGDTESITSTVAFPNSIEVLDAYPLNSTKGSSFNFDGNTSSTNIPQTLKGSAGSASYAYDQFYKDFVSTSMNSNGSPSASGNEVTFSYRVKLNTPVPMEAVTYGYNKWDNDIWKLFGGKDQVQNPKVKAAIENALLQGRNGTANGNKLYVIFCPTVIVYKKYVTIGDLVADLDLPESAKQGETFQVSDASLVDESLILESSRIKFRINGGAWQYLVTWPGKGIAGANSGGVIDQKFDDICVVDYEILATATNGQTSIKVKTINITDSREVDGKAILELPEYTYEGHPALAQDHSVFTVDGVNYSARRAYEEDVADNEFIPLPYSAGSADQFDLTRANVVFPKRGFYKVKLEVNTVSGKTLTDNKPIEVRKTPCIIDHLGGFQKQNRKQILTAAVATYPGKPIVDYYIKLKDLKTGQEIALTKDRPQQNNATMKTRTVTSKGDSYWTNFTLEFLTKNTETQEYQYTIYVKDSKGDTDSVQKVFAVKPDLPPNPVILVQDSFIRNEGTNVAEILTEDASTTDGDQLERTWSVEETNIKSFDGYKDLSFGTGQKVKFNQTGVGPVEVKLDVKDIWIEPTLEEYITEGDYLSASTTKTTDVINIAPTVRLEPKPSRETDIVIIIDKKNKTEIGASLNTLKAALIEKGFDPNISLAVAADADDGPYREVAHWSWPTTVNCPICNQNSLLMDSEYTYRVTSPGRKPVSYYETCVTDQPHILEAVTAGKTADSGSIAWSYPVNESRNFKVYLDNQERYVYLSCGDINKTTVLNRDNGAYLTTLNMALPGTPIIGNDTENIYFVGGVNISKYDTSSGKMTTITNRGGSLTQVIEGKIVFVGKKGTNAKFNKNGIGWYIGKLDLKSETIDETAIPDLPNTTGPVAPADMDNTGKVLFKQGGNMWVADTKNYTVKMTPQVDSGTHMNSNVFVKNEKGEAVYAINAHNSTDYKMSSSYTFRLFDMSGSDLQCVCGFTKSFYGWNWNGISYAKLHSRENKIYILQGSNFEGLTGTSNPYGFCFRINLPSMSIDSSINSWGWDIAEEEAAYSGSLMGTYYTHDRWTGQEDRIQLFRNALSEQEAKTFALRKYTGDDSDKEKYVVIAGDSAASQILNDENFKGELDKLNAKGLFFDVEGAINTIAQQITDLGDNLKSFLHLEGDGFGNTAAVEHDVQLQPGTEYEYEYNMTATTGKAIDLFQVKNPNSQGMTNDNKYFERVAAFINFTDGSAEPFFKIAGGTVHSSSYEGYGYGTMADYRTTGSCSATFTMEKDGYISFDQWMGESGYKRGSHMLYYYINGKLVGSDGTGGRNTLSTRKKIFLDQGSYTLTINETATNSTTYHSINNLKAVYFEDTAHSFVPASVVNVNDKEQTVKNNFMVDGEESMEVKTVKTAAMTTRSGIEYGKYITSGSTHYYYEYVKYIDGYTKWGTPIYRYRKEPRYGAGPKFAFDEKTGIYSFTTNWNADDTYTVDFNITAPSDKILIYSYNRWFSGGYNTDSSQPGEKLYPTTEVRVLRPGKSHSLSARMQCSSKTGPGTLYISNIKIAEFDANDFGGPEALQVMNIYADNYGIQTPGSSSDYICTTLDKDQINATLKYVVGLNTASSSILNNGISLSTTAGTDKISALISNFRLFKVVGGVRQLIFSQDFTSDKTLDLAGWRKLTTGTGKAEIITDKAPVKEEEAPLVYKKGQLVAYNIYYDDYEKDPSKKQYWRYTHTPYNDGPHPKAAFILNEEGNVVSSNGAILPESIPRFYIDGKYTVEHWQEDNTNRTGDTTGKVDYTKYDKLSNVESITFYVQGGASAPWITSIKTIPGTVKENDLYKLQIGVDDLEKDELRLTTEVYKDKKLIYTHRQTGIKAGANGNYPFAITGNPPLAAAGKYEVVCTVRDWSGAGLGTYQYLVVSEEKIAGSVSHTEQWDQNRKKYNLKRFSDEVNRQITLDDYMALPIPRKRGTNVFWSGENFVLRAETEGNPSRVEVKIRSKDALGKLKDTGYRTNLTKSGEKTSKGEEIWKGSLWDKAMINQWGRKNPVELTFQFTAYYSGGKTKEHSVPVIIDSDRDYWQLHRLW